MVQEASKEQLIAAIKGVNRTASEAFLAQFGEAELRDYLGSLRANRRSYRTFRTHGARQEVAVAR